MTSQQGDVKVEQLCAAAGVSRSGYYRYLMVHEPDAEEMELRDRIQRLFLQHRRRYGYRRISAQLRIEGLCVNHKRVARLMREDNLLSIRPRSFVRTTDASHPFEVALNLAKRMRLTGADQLWVADITYIRLAGEFVFLAVVLDAFSRKVVGWSLDRSLKAGLAVTALRKGIEDRRPPAGLVHHSDRGVQYACTEYRGLLLEHGITASMSRPANPYDNASCESFMHTLKQEEIRATCYRDIEHLRHGLTEFIDEYYNKVRLHSALGYSSPEAFEQAHPEEAVAAAGFAYFCPKPQAAAQATATGGS
jgi:transposase InsO family protein